MNMLSLKGSLLARQHELRASQMPCELKRSADRREDILDYDVALVADALQRLDAGNYGICLECEDSISERRLKAVPWAKFCIRCQQRADKAMDQMSEAA